MSLLMPADREVLAAAAVDSIVVASDRSARSSSAYFWDRGRPWTDAVVRAVTNSEDPAIQSLGKDLVADPGDPARYFALRSALLDAGADTPATAAIYDLAWQAECNSRLGFQLGRRYERGELPVTAGELLSLPPGTPAADSSQAEVLIVIPFQDRGAGRHRLRNLLACLASLRDQSCPEDTYQVTVVESDEAARWGDVIRPRAGHYIFASKPGAFNKSWTVNVGVAHTPGQHEVICILDADVLVDREFVERNTARFRRPGTGGHLTYRNMLSLDEPATSHAIRERLQRREPQASPDHFRGFLLRRPPGCCVWVRSAAFSRIGGMDERYEGWGGEDYDFLHRLDLDAPLDSYHDWLLHMHHPPSAFIREDGGLADIPPLSWRPEEPVGRLDRFAAGGHPDPAGRHPDPAG